MMKQNAKIILNDLTLEEKVSLCSGKDFWNLQEIKKHELPSIMVTDGPHGLRKQVGSADHLGILDSVPATCFPTAAGLASTWNNELIYEMGEKLGEECLTENVAVLLGPGVNIKRHPLCGRNFEYFSEDPYLSGKAAASLINGIQSKGIGTSLKHYVANNQETMRMVVDTIVDERTLRELYLKSFEIAVKESQPWTVMCSYNKVNGTYWRENKRLLNDILKEEWGHKGLVVTDWGACNNRVEGLIAGQNLEMPGSNGVHDAEIIEAINDGTLDKNVFNQRVERVVNLLVKADETFKKNIVVYDKENHHQFARKVAAESIVLLQNKNNILPLKTDEITALIGEFAVKPRYQGSGSSLINPTKIAKAYDAFKGKLGNNFKYARGYDVKTDILDDALLKEAVELAKTVKNVVLMVGLTDKYESEGFDRLHLNIPNNHLVLIEEISKVNKNIIICLSNGSPIAMPWKDNVLGIIEQYLGGQASGEALCDIVFGDVNPSGKLAETFPNNLEEFPSNQNFPGLPRQVEYKEGLYVGYRFYDTAEVKPLFPFGFGLSYTSFEYSSLVIMSKSDEEIEISFEVKNTGKVFGKEVVQIYISKDKSIVYRPKKELKSYVKVELNPNESKTLKIKIPYRDLSIYNISEFKVEDGEYNVLICSSSIDVRLQSEIVIKSSDKIVDTNNKNYYNIDKTFAPSKKAFEMLYGEEMPEYPNIRPFHINSTLGELKITFIGRKILDGVRKEMSKVFGDEGDDSMALMVESMVEEMPLRSLVALSNGEMNNAKAEGLLDLMNKKIFRGIVKLIKG